VSGSKTVCLSGPPYSSFPPQAAFGGFFGPIGVGTLYFAALAYGRIESEDAFAVVSFVVLASIIVHGVLATPLSLSLHYALKHWKEDPIQPTGGGVPSLKEWLH
jgi:NhaP-type Na+/H+ or K+/H+ antiporter